MCLSTGVRGATEARSRDECCLIVLWAGRRAGLGRVRGGGKEAVYSISIDAE